MPLHVSSTMCSSSGGKIVLYGVWYQHNVGGRPVHQTATYRYNDPLNLCTGRPPTDVMIPDAV